ncbi:MAG: hypothetical protein ABSF59_01065 [Candidatus Sulfotelmatobacter sp.]|jgi:hypothetical protein
MVVSFYALAKVLQALDKPISAAGHIVSVTPSSIVLLPQPVTVSCG